MTKSRGFVMADAVIAPFGHLRLDDDIAQSDIWQHTRQRES